VKTSPVIVESFAPDTVNADDSCYINGAMFDQACTVIKPDKNQQSVSDHNVYVGMTRYQTVQGSKVYQNGGRK